MNLRELWDRPLARAWMAVALVGVLGCCFHADGAFFRWPTHRDMLRQVAVYGLLACGMTPVILTAGIDLAVGSIVAVSAVAAAKLIIFGGVDPVLAAGVVSLGGLALGGLSGAVIAKFRVQPFVVTLAMMVLARGLAKQLSGGQKVTAYAAGLSPTEATGLLTGLDTRLLGDQLATVTAIMIACAIFTWVLLRRTRLGRHIYAVGGNPEAARLAGVPVGWTIFWVYAYCGLCAAIAGLCQAAQETQGDPDTAMGYELDAIAMVVIGGTSLMGGRGGVGLTVLGVLTIGWLQKILSLNAVPEASRLMATGVILIGAILFQRRKHA